MLFSYLFPWLLWNWFCNRVWQVTFFPWQPAQDWTLHMFWSWGGVSAQFSSHHFSPSNFSCTDAKAHYWTASMVINSNFSATSFWPPINPSCFVTQSWDMLQHDRTWHFKTISVPPHQLSVPSVFDRWKKKIYLCALGLGKACGMAIPAAILFLELQALQPSNGIWYGNGRRNTSWVSSQQAGILQGISHWKWQFCLKKYTHWKSFTCSLCGFHTKTKF